MGEWDTGYSAYSGTPADGDDFLIRQLTATPPSGGTLRRLSVSALRAALVPVLPSFNVNTYGADPTGVNDSTAAFVTAYSNAAATLSGSTPGAYVVLGPGTYKVTAGNCVTSDPRIGLRGAGSQITQVNAYGSGDAFYHYTASFNTGSNEGTTGLGISGLTIDGTHTTGASTGLHIQDICSLRLDDLQIQNFTAGSNQTFTAGTGPNIVTTGSSNGIRFTGNNNWSERLLFLGVRTSNCSIHYNFDGTTDPAGGCSWDYMRMLDAYSEIHPGQVGLMLQGFAQLDQPTLFYSYNMVAQASAAASYAVVIGPTDPSSELSRIRNALFNVRGEMDGSGSTCYGLRIGSWAQLTGTGTWVNVGSMTAGALNSGSIFVSGYISTPEFPANHALFTLPGGGATAFYGGSNSFACYTGQFVNTPGSKGLTLLDQAAGSSTVRSTLFSGAGNPGGVYGTNLSGDLYIRQDGLSAPSSQLWLATASNSNTWQPVVAAAIASGTATLAAGSVTVANASITANSIIRVHNISQAGTVGALSISLSAGTSFTVHSTSGADTSKVFWEVVSF